MNQGYCDDRKPCHFIHILVFVLAIIAILFLNERNQPLKESFMDNTDPNATDYVDESLEMDEPVSANGEEGGDTDTAVSPMVDVKTVNADNGPPKQKPRKYHPRQLRKDPEIGRNEPCPCGSGTKFKKCCLIKQHEQMTNQMKVKEKLEELKKL